jgi:hypothetical protein
MGQDVALHAVVLMHRTLSLIEDKAATDTVGILSASLLIAKKAQSVSFKMKHLVEIIMRVYCRVYSRSEDSFRDSVASLDPYITKAFASEAMILRELRGDVFIPYMHRELKAALKLVIARRLRGFAGSPEVLRAQLAIWTDSLNILSSASKFVVAVHLYCPHTVSFLSVQHSFIAALLLQITASQLSKFHGKNYAEDCQKIAKKVSTEVKLLLAALVLTASTYGMNSSDLPRSIHHFFGSVGDITDESLAAAGVVRESLASERRELGIACVTQMISAISDMLPAVSDDLAQEATVSIPQKSPSNVAPQKRPRDRTGEHSWRRSHRKDSF